MLFIIFIAAIIQPSLKSTAVAQSSFQCSASLAGPVVNIVHVEDEQPVTPSSSTSCVATSEDQHVHICSTVPISTDMSLSNTDSIDINASSSANDSNSTGDHLTCIHLQFIHNLLHTYIRTYVYMYFH